MEDAQKLDDVREALRQGDLSKASQLGRVLDLYLLADETANQDLIPLIAVAEAER